MDIHRHIFILSGFENTILFISSAFFPLSCNDNNYMTYKWPNSSFFNFQENANQENFRQYSCIIFFNWQIGTKNLTKRKIIFEPSFFTSWTITSVNAHGRTCNLSIYLSISLYENLFKNGYIYTYERAQRVSKILFLLRENKIHIFKPPCNVLFII